jgi:hypothetical protein
MNFNTIFLGILISIVIILFLFVYHNNTNKKNITNVHNALNIIENFQPTSTHPAQPTPSITFKSVCGEEISTVNSKIPIPNSDDYHTIIISNVPSAIYNSDKVTISFMTSQGNDIREYTGIALDTIKTDSNTFTIKQTLSENSKYVLKLNAKDAAELKFTFTTDYNTFTYNPIPTNTTITANTASNYLVIGIKKREDTNYIYQLNYTDPNILNISDSNYTYNLEIPNLNTYINAVITKLKQNGNTCIESEYKELSKYIPYKFDALLTVNRIKDPYPLETVIVPSINCISSNKCIVTLRNLRRRTEYTIKIRLIYFKAGSENNYRSSPMVQWTFNTGESGDNFFETIDQLNKLLTTVKNASINADIFNKEQIVQNNRLAAIESEFLSKIQPRFS